MSVNTSLNQDEDCSCDLSVISLTSPTGGGEEEGLVTACSIPPPTATMSCRTASNNKKAISIRNNNNKPNNNVNAVRSLTCGNRVHGFMSELKQVGSDLAHKINLLTDIDDELALALNRLETQEEEIVRYRQQVYKLEADLKARNCKVKDLERKVCEQNGQSQEAVTQARLDVEVAAGRVKQLEECLDEQRRNNGTLDQRIEALKNKLRSSEKAAAYYRSLNVSQEKTLESKRRIIEDLQQQTAQYLERVVEFERAKMTSKYMDQCDVEDQLQAAKMMLKEKDFEITQLWENLTVLENAVCANLSEIGVERRNYTKDTLIAQAARNQSQQPPCCNLSKYNNNLTASDECQQQQMMMAGGCMSPVGSRCGGNKDTCTSSSKFEEVSNNLQHILKKITQLKHSMPANQAAAAALTGGQHGGAASKNNNAPAVQCASMAEFNGCTCAK